MSERWTGLAGRMEGGAHILPVRVYYEDTDAGGVVYHANYLKYCERGRTDFLRVRGLRQSAMPGLFFVVRRMACEFMKPARLDDLLEVETRLVDMGGARLDLDQCVRRDTEVLFSASVTVALVDGTGRPRRLPDDLAILLKSPSESAS
jgi:acyl-CoA thioester hydrolase